MKLSDKMRESKFWSLFSFNFLIATVFFLSFGAIVGTSGYLEESAWVVFAAVIFTLMDIWTGD